MSETVITISGRDNVTPTLNGVTNAMRKMDEDSEKYLGRMRQQFEEITNPGAKSLKTQLRALQGILANLNFKGLDDTELFTEIATKAGEMKDSLSDASQAVRLLSSDTASLDATIQGFQAITGVATVATGVMGLFGEENENVQKAILRVQSALGILNGIQSVANALNKDSILRLKLKQIWTAATTKEETKNTVATTANTVATTANTTAQNAFNRAKAIGKAMMGDFTGLMLLAGTALATYAVATSNADDEQKELNDTTDDSTEKIEKYKDTLESTYANLMTQYAQLGAEWRNLANTHAKNEWIKENGKKLNELGISVKNVQTVEEAFVNNTGKVTQGFIARAKAAAYLSQLTDNYKKQMEIIDQIDEAQQRASAWASQRPRVSAGQEITDERDRNSNYGKVNSEGKWYYTEEGAKYHNTGNDPNNSYIDKLRKKQQQLEKEAKEITTKIANEYKKIPNINDASTGGGKNGKTGTTSKKESVYRADADTIEEIKENIDYFTKKLEKTQVNTEEYTKVSGELKTWKDKLSEVEATTKGYEKGSLADYEAQVKEIGEQLENLKLTDEQRVILMNKQAEIQKQIKELQGSGFDKGSVSDLTSQLQEIQNQLDNKKLDLKTRIKLEESAYELQQQLDATYSTATIKVKTLSFEQNQALISRENAQQSINNLQDLQEAGLITKAEFKKDVAEINGELASIGQTPIKVDIQTNFEEIEGQLNTLFDMTSAIDGVYNSVKNLKTAFDEGANGWEIFMDIMNVGQSILSAVGSIINVVNTAQEIFGVTTGVTTGIQAGQGTESVTSAGLMVASESAKTAAAKATTSALLEEAAAGYMAAHAYIPFAGYGIAAGFTASAVATVMAAGMMGGLAENGGIVNYGSTTGDKTMVFVNRGEQILTKRQSDILTSKLNDLGGGMGGNVVFRLQGKELVGLFQNYNTSRNKRL